MPRNPDNPRRRGSYLKYFENGQSPFRCKPGFQVYYAIGSVADKRLPKFKTLREIGQELGISHQNVYTESVLALGKLLYGIAQIIHEVPEL